MIKVLTAYTNSGKVWEYKPSIYYNSEDHPSRPGAAILHIYGWMNYYTQDLLNRSDDISNKFNNELCIDAGGRNHGVDESVYINFTSIKDYLSEQGFLACQG